MKANHLSITTLEEHEPNREFLGRNFNAGEIIQLVLRAPRSGNWLSFRAVQMVMMHELAHCEQMNHGKGFWKVNNRFKGELRELWAKGYTGDGLWGRGQTLLSGEYDTGGGNRENEIVPERLCGGTFRSRRRKRRRMGNGGEETYAEVKQRRIAKKFGVNGATLGGDEGTRVKLEYGKNVKGKPRVANSARGRELRVAAAAARFGQQKQTQGSEGKEERKTKENHEVDDESEVEEGQYEEVEHGEQATNPDGSQMLDRQGHDMVRICTDRDEDQSDAHVKEEMDELQELNGPPTQQSTLEMPQPETGYQTTSSEAQNAITCPVCSFSNDTSSSSSSSSPLCTACSHVLHPDKLPGAWRCQSEACSSSSSSSKYINAADCGVCGVCGDRKITSSPPTT